MVNPMGNRKAGIGGKLYSTRQQQVRCITDMAGGYSKLFIALPLKKKTKERPVKMFCWDSGATDRMSKDIPTLNSSHI